MDKMSITLKPFPSLDKNSIEDDLFQRKLASSYEKGNTIQSIYKPLKIVTEVYFSTLKQSYPDFGEILNTHGIILKNRITNIKELTMLYLRLMFYY